MSRELRGAFDRFTERERVRRAELAAALGAAQRAAQLAGAAHAPGDRVFDPVTGLEGEVLHAARENVVVQSAKR